MKFLFPISLMASLLFSLGGWAQVEGYDPANPIVTGHDLPKEFEDVGVDEHLGSQLDLSLPFVSDLNEPVTLGRYFNGTKPVLMAMVYYTCPSLCNHHLNALNDTMKQLKWTVGQEFEVVAVTMNHREGPDVAAAKKANYVKNYGRPESIDGWHFLTGTEESINQLANQLGFKFQWIEDQQQYAHAAVAYVVTPGGKISRYLYGLAVDEETLRLSLIEASNGKIGTVVDQLILYCLQFDPGKNKFTLYAWNVMRLGGGLVLVVMALILVPIWIREKKKSQSKA